MDGDNSELYNLVQSDKIPYNRQIFNPKQERAVMRKYSVMPTAFPALILTAFFLLSGCVAAPVKVVDGKVPRDVPVGATAKPIQFKKIVVKLKRGQSFGKLSVGLLCIPHGDLTWRGGRATISAEDFSEAFREELEKANYVVVGNPDALFEDPSEWKAEILVSGMVKEMEANYCFPFAGMGDFSTTKGGAYLKVNWQIYSRLDRKVVYEISTEGSFQTDQAQKGSEITILTNAFAQATQNLLADSGFHNLVIGGQAGVQGVTAGLDQPEILVKAIKPYSESITKNMSHVRAGVVTVIAGPGHGSGFFIGSDGFILTNEHVVREAKFVKIKLATGREIVGEVVRKDSGRDVALLRVEERGMSPLPIRAKDLNVGEEVYAIGSPLSEKLNTTITKGIVSNFRVENGRNFIQSDVQVLPGSSGGPLVDSNGCVAGIAVSGVVLQSGVPAGLNFFIPAGEAMKTLGVSCQY